MLNKSIVLMSLFATKASVALAACGLTPKSFATDSFVGQLNGYCLTSSFTSQKRLSKQGKYLYNCI